MPHVSRGETIPAPTEVFDRVPRRASPEEEPQSRRLSSFNALLSDAPKPIVAAYVDRPKFAGRKLASLRLTEVLRFCEEIRAFVAENGSSSAQVPIGKFIETDGRTVYQGDWENDYKHGRGTFN